MIKDEDSHPLKDAIAQVKDFLRQTKYERLLTLDKVSKNKDEFKVFLEALSKILAALHRSAIDKNRQKQAKTLISDRKLVLDSLKALENNSNARLLCLNLLLNLKN